MRKTKISKNIIFLIWILITILFLSGCLRPLQPDPLESDVPAFIPPTLIPPTPTLEIVEPTQQSNGETQESSCIDNLTFIQDETIPDGSIVAPGSDVIKTWELKNSGTCNWGPGYTIRVVGGEALGATSPQDLFPARSGTSLSLEIKFIAPDQAGKFRSVWQAYSPNDSAFGETFYVDFTVEE